MARGNDTTGTSLLSDDGRKIAAQLAGGRCPVCRKRMVLWGADRKSALTIDHVHAHANGGGVEGNLIPLCGTCNSSKQDTPLKPWLKKRLAEVRNVSRVMGDTVARKVAEVEALRDQLTNALIDEGVWSKEAA